MKKLLILGAMEMHVPLIKRAKEMGNYVITVDYIPENPGHKLADEAYYDSTTDLDAVLKLSKKLNIDGIMTYNSDPAAPTAAYVAEKLGLPGNPYQSVKIMSEKNLRAEKLNGEDKYTSDGRLIYNKETGIFDVSYSAAFNLGKLVTLSHIPEAQKITLWRKQQKIKSHLKCLNEEFSINIHELTEVIMKMKEDKLR